MHHCMVYVALLESLTFNKLLPAAIRLPIVLLLYASLALHLPPCARYQIEFAAKYFHSTISCTHIIQAVSTRTHTASGKTHFIILYRTMLVFFRCRTAHETKENLHAPKIKQIIRNIAEVWHKQMGSELFPHSIAFA